MALQKDISTRYGIIANYTKIISIDINWHLRTAGIEAYTFVSQTTRLAGEDYVRRFFISILPEDFPFLPEEPIVEIAYSLLKELPEFEGAIDV